MKQRGKENDWWTMILGLVVSATNYLRESRRLSLTINRGLKGHILIWRLLQMKNQKSCMPFYPRQNTNLILMARLSVPAYEIFLRFFDEFNVDSHLERHCEVNGQKVNWCKTNWHSICNLRQVYIFYEIGKSTQNWIYLIEKLINSIN